MSRPMLAALLSLSLLLVVLSGCGGGGGAGPVPPPPPPESGLPGALKAPLPSAPVPSAPGSDGVLLLREIVEDRPTAPAAWLELLNRCLAHVRAHQEDPAGQLALVLSMLGFTSDELAADLDYDLFKTVSKSVLTSPAGLAQVAVHGDVARQFAGRDNTALQPPAQATTAAAKRGLDPTQVQQAIRDHLLRALYSEEAGETGVIQKLEVLAALPTSEKLIEFHSHGRHYALYSKDFSALTAATRMLRALLLTMLAYNVDENGFNWHEAPWHKLPLGTAVGPDQYLPPSPCLTLHATGAAELRAAIADMRSALERLRDVGSAPPADPQSVLNQVLLDAGSSAQGLSEHAQDYGKLLSPRGTAGELRWWAKVEKCVDWQPQETITDLPIKLAALWDNPVTDVKSLLPTMHVRLRNGSRILRLESASDLPDPTLGGLFGADKAIQLAEALFNPPGTAQRYHLCFKGLSGRTHSLRYPLPRP